MAMKKTIDTMNSNNSSIAYSPSKMTEGELKPSIKSLIQDTKEDDKPKLSAKKKSSLEHNATKREQKLKSTNHDKVKGLVAKHKLEQKLLKDMYSTQAKKDKKNYERELQILKRNYQEQLEDIRRIYENQNLKMQNAARDLSEKTVQEIKRMYEETKPNDQLNKLEKWLHEELVSGQLRNLTHQLEQTKSFYDLEINRLNQQIHEKNEDIIFLEDRIKEIAEEYLPENARKDLFDELDLNGELTPHQDHTNDSQIPVSEQD